MPSVTVIVPTRNRPDLLHEALDSVSRQTFNDFECVVVDDSSNPPAQIPDDRRFRLVRIDGSGGCSAARNTGIVAATGTYVAFLDDDDLWTPDHLEHLMAQAGTDRIVTTQRGDLATHRPAAPRALGANAHDTIVDSYVPSLGQTLILREACPQFDETFAAVEDVDWWIRATARTNRIVTVGALTYLVRQHAGERAGHGRPVRLLASYQLLRKHADYFRSHPRARWFRILRIAQLESKPGYAVASATRALAAARTPKQAAVSARVLARAVIRR